MKYIFDKQNYNARKALEGSTVYVDFAMLTGSTQQAQYDSKRSKQRRFDQERLLQARKRTTNGDPNSRAFQRRFARNYFRKPTGGGQLSQYVRELHKQGVLR